MCQYTGSQVFCCLGASQRSAQVFSCMLIVREGWPQPATRCPRIKRKPDHLSTVDASLSLCGCYFGLARILGTGPVLRWVSIVTCLVNLLCNSHVLRQFDGVTSQWFRPWLCCRADLARSAHRRSARGGGHTKPLQRYSSGSKSPCRWFLALKQFGTWHRTFAEPEEKPSQVSPEVLPLHKWVPRSGRWDLSHAIHRGPYGLLRDHAFELARFSQFASSFLKFSKLTWCLCGDRQDYTSSKTSEFSWQLTACSRACRCVHSQWVVKKRASTDQDFSWTLWTFEVRMVLHIQAPGTLSVSNMNAKNPFWNSMRIWNLSCEELWFDERCICFCAVRCFNTCTGGVFSVFLYFYRFLPAQDVWIHANGGWWDHGSMVAHGGATSTLHFGIFWQCLESTPSVSTVQHDSTCMDCR